MYNDLKSNPTLKELADESYAAKVIDLCRFSLQLLKSDCIKIELVSKASALVRSCPPLLG